MEQIAIDAEVKVLYQEKLNDIVDHYIIFLKVYNEQRRQHGSTKEGNVLKEYLENKEQIVK